MFPHQKLDWTISRLEKQVEAAADDVEARLKLGRSCFSKARFHGGGELWHNKALTHARRILQQDPANPGALVITGMSLSELDRVDIAGRYLDEALRVAPDHAEVHYAVALLHCASTNRHDALRELETACRLAPDSWETHMELGRVLQERADELGSPPRMIERSQFHVVRALQLDPSPTLWPQLIHDLGVSCLRTGRVAEAHRLFLRLQDAPLYQQAAQYYLGLVSYRMGKFKHAILYFRQYLEPRPQARRKPGERRRLAVSAAPVENPQVHARIGMAYLQLGEPEKAREACNRALTIEPTDLLARWTLGCAFLEEGQSEEAVKAFRSILEDAPDHIRAFGELVRIRAIEGDIRWLRQALRSEVGVFDRLAVSAFREDPNLTRMVRISPRDSTRARIRLVLNALGDVDNEASRTMLQCLDLTTDEGLRFLLWETALTQLSNLRARRLKSSVEDAGHHFNAARGREVLVLADQFPEDLLTRGLQIDETDLKRAAVDRHGPVQDVSLHRTHIEQERREARAWQALLLVAIATHGTKRGRNLLVRWAADADSDLSFTARVALAIQSELSDVATSTDSSGSPMETIREKARSRGAEELVDRLVDHTNDARQRTRPRPLTDDESATCTTCGLRQGEVEHMVTGGTSTTICNHCLAEIARRRSTWKTEDPTVQCALTGDTVLEAEAVYIHPANVAISLQCVELSLGLQEREEVDRYLSSF